MRSVVSLCFVSLVSLVSIGGCDNTRTEEKAQDKGKTAFDLKQTPSTKKSQAELEEARRKAGFKSNEEVMAEAKEKYERDSKVYIKEHLADYRKLLADVRKKLDEVEKAAPKWANAAAFESWNEKYKKDVSKIIKGYDELTKKGSEGGNTQSQLGGAIQAWEDLGGDLGPEIAKQEAFATTLAEIRKQLDAVGTVLDEIEKDETLVATPEPGPEGDAKAGDAKAGDAKADDKKADDKKADDKKSDDKKSDDKKAG
jgi:hypothetical protein